jgi:hypothetical protein
MSTFLDKLNLRPQERRLVVMGSAVLFIVLQFWLVWPHFKDWGQVRGGLEQAKKRLADYRKEIARTNEYQLRLEQLEREDTSILVEERAQPNFLINQILAQAGRSKLNSGNINHVPPARTARTNVFFEEQTISLGVNPTDDEALIDFLVAMGSSELMIRVKELDLRPDPNGYKLMGSMKLVASFQKNSATKPTPAKPGPLTAARP